MNFLQLAVWGAYLISMGNYLVHVRLASYIGLFYAMQGIVSLFMPAIMGILADRRVPAQKLLGYLHFLAALFMSLTGYYAMTAGQDVKFGPLFTLYSLSVAFYMPTISLDNSVAYSALDKANLDIIRHFPTICLFGTVGFVCSMWAVDILGFQDNYRQFFISALIEVVLASYAFTLPSCPTHAGNRRLSLTDTLGLKAFILFKQKEMVLFFLFSILLGIALQITNGFANPYISSFATIPEYAHTFAARHANILISLSQISEALCLLLIPFFLKRFGIKRIMLISMLAWVLRFYLLGAGTPSNGVWMFILSMVVYGIAYDFFTVAGSIFVDQKTDKAVRSSAQGLFSIMINGFGASIGTLGAQAVVSQFVDFDSYTPQISQWQTVWYIFAAYALAITILFALLFKSKDVRIDKNQIIN